MVEHHYRSTEIKPPGPDWPLEGQSIHGYPDLPDRLQQLDSN